MLTICDAGWWGLGKSPTMLPQPGEAMLEVMLTLQLEELLVPF